MKRVPKAATAALIPALLAVFFIFRHHFVSAPPQTSGPLQHQAYVWQRTWDGRVQEAMSTLGTNFERLVVLAAEVSWDGPRPRLAQAELDFKALRDQRRPIGLALRMGVLPAGSDEVTRWLVALAKSIVQAAQTNQVPLAEFQIDFDCAESKLAGYRDWVVAIRSGIAPVPLTITVLPAWLKRKEFAALVAATDGYVLQVHSLERPRSSATPIELCHPAAAQRWVELAGRLGIPFRVALPTYGYGLAFDASGRLLGLNAEGPQKIFSGTSFYRETHADPAAMAGLVQQWVKQRPSAMGTVIWYRLPVAGDNLNWSWSTMSEVIAGRIPTSELKLRQRSPQRGLIEIGVCNAGRADFAGEPAVRARWTRRRFVAADGLSGFAVTEPAARAVDFTVQQPMRLKPGESRWIGWLRLDEEEEVKLELLP